MKHIYKLVLLAGIMLGPLTYAFAQMTVIPPSPPIPPGPAVVANAQSAKARMTFSNMNCKWSYVATDANGDQTGACVVTGDVSFSLGNGENLGMSDVTLASFPMNISQANCSAICNSATSGCP